MEEVLAPAVANGGQLGNPLFMSILRSAVQTAVRLR